MDSKERRKKRQARIEARRWRRLEDARRRLSRINRETSVLLAKVSEFDGHADASKAIAAAEAIEKQCGILGVALQEIEMRELQRLIALKRKQFTLVDEQRQGGANR